MCDRLKSIAAALFLLGAPLAGQIPKLQAKADSLLRNGARQSSSRTYRTRCASPASAAVATRSAWAPSYIS